MTAAGNLLSANVGSINTLPAEIRKEREMEARVRVPSQPQRDTGFDPLSSCIGSLSRDVREASPEYRAAQAEETKAP